jgi:eukaryotic-like serine/threonine-protein kinase
MTNCPSEATLRLVGTDAVGESTFSGLERHVEQCPDCQRVLEAATDSARQAFHPTPARITPPSLPGLVIDRELGRGGSSVVYLAWETTLNRHVALKLFPRNSLADPHSREHWLAEARSLSRVQHDHVVAIHRVDETAEWLWHVIEYAPGGTLKDRLTEPLPPREAARLTETIASTVGYFHTRGLVHLDLKPSNILLDGEPGAPWETVSPKISDFGIARLEGEPGTTETGAHGPKGTPSYMAPEQVAAVRGTIGPAADIHALGALLYHALTGRPPFQGASSAETLDQVRNQDPAPPRRLNPRIPRDLDTICLKCLEKSPTGRYRSAEALAGDLRLWLDGRPIRARRVSPMGHTWRWCRRHPAVAGLLLALALTVVMGVVGLFVLLNQAATERARLAEARRHAEAYERFSASAADQLAIFLGTTVRQQRNTTPDQMSAALLRLRNSTRELKTRGIVPSSTIGILEEEIAFGLRSLNKIDESRDLLRQAISDLEQSVAKNPHESAARSSLSDALLLSGDLSVGVWQIENALNSFEQAAAMHMASDLHYVECCALTTLCIRLQFLADRLGRGGQTAQKERSQRLSQLILRHLLESETANSTDASTLGLEALGRLLQRDDLKRMASGDDKRIRDGYERMVGDWLALSVGSLSPFRPSPAAANFGRDPEAGAITLISAIRERCSKLGLADSMVSRTVRVIFIDAVAEAADQRKLGRLDDARATAARLMTIAIRLVQEYPDSANSYRVLSEAHNQIRKNAIRSQDKRLEEESLVAAIEAARSSLALDPDNIETRHHFDTLTERLIRMKADHTTKRVPEPSTQRR